MIRWDRYFAVLDQIKNFPYHWFQNAYHHGNQHCFGGVCHLFDAYEKGLLLVKAEVDTENLIKNDKNVISANYFSYKDEMTLAGEFLNIDTIQRYWLFSTERTIEDLENCFKTKAIPYNKKLLNTPEENEQNYNCALSGLRSLLPDYLTGNTLPEYLLSDLQRAETVINILKKYHQI